MSIEIEEIAESLGYKPDKYYSAGENMFNTKSEPTTIGSKF